MQLSFLQDNENVIIVANATIKHYNGKVIIMVLITFKDGVSIELHKDMTFDVVELSETDVMFNYYASVSNKEVELFNLINNRLGGVLSS